MKKTKFLNNYKSYAFTNDFLALKKLTDDTTEYIKNNNIIDFNKVAINGEFLQHFNVAIDSIFNKDTFVDKWHKLSNTKKRESISKNLVLFCLKRDFFFDRSNSTYNKEAKAYTKKSYVLDVKVKLNELFYQIALDINGDTFNM